MNATRLLQIPIVLTLLFGSVGTNGHVSASADPQPREVLQTQPSVSITVLPAVIALNETATATVSLNDVPAEGYTSAEFRCTFRADLVQVSDIVLTGLFGPDPATAIYGPQDGTFIVGIAGSQGNKATAGGPAFTFRVKGLGTGQAALDCTARVSDGSNVLTGIGSASAGLTIMEATATPTIAPVPCDKAEFITDINVPPGTVMAPEAQFIKTWRLKNVGSCTWTTSYRLAFLSSEQMGAPSSVRLPVNVAPGQTVDVSLNMTAPSVAGSYRGYWIFQNDTGKPFGIGLEGNQPWFVDIMVSNATLTPTPTFTDTPSVTPNEPGNSPTPSITPVLTITPGGPTATPIMGVAYDFATNACVGNWYSGAGQLPCPGIDGNSKGFVLKLDHPRLETGAIDTNPGLLTFPQNVQNGYIQGFYPPFHVQSGDRFRSKIGCEGGATNCYVAFRLDYQVGSDPIRTFWGPWLERYEGKNSLVDVDLSPLAGKDVKFILTVLSAGVATGDRALWVGPIIYRSDLIATATPTLTPTSTPTPVPSSTPLTSSNFIQVTSPNGGEVLIVGSTYRITWNSTSDIHTVYIGYKWSNSGMDWIAPGIPNTGYYDWNVLVGQMPTTQVKIYIYGYGTADASDESDGFITILKPTPTVPPSGTLVGRVLASKPVTVQLYNLDDSLVALVPANADGTFSLTVPAGRYDILASATGHLSILGAATIVGGSTSTQPTTKLLAGDINGDTRIDQYDALTIGMNYNTASPSAADLNDDGIINVLDLELLAKNYRSSGPVPWQ